MRQTTGGWKFHVKWKYGTFIWTFLKYLKKSNPIEMAEYVTACSIQYEPDFAWCVHLPFESETESLQQLTPASGKQHTIMA